MKYISIILSFLILTSCSTKKQILYLNDMNKLNIDSKIDYSLFNSNIEVGDILQIDIQTVVPEAALPYNNFKQRQNNSQNIDLKKLDGYVVDNFKMINYPVLGKISVAGLNESELEKKITNLLLDGNHLMNPTVRIRTLNSKITILGEVAKPGTYPFFDKNLNIFQALGYAGDLTIDGKRKNVILIREENESREIYKFDLSKSNLLNTSYYYLKNNDVLIINPSYNKVKSAGFVGSPSSVASIASILLSITLLILNK